MLNCTIVSSVGLEPTNIIYDIVRDSVVDFTFVTSEPEQPKATCVAAKPWTIAVLITIT